MATNQSKLEVLLTLNDKASTKINSSLGSIDKQSKTTTTSLLSMGQSMMKYWLMAAAAVGALGVALKAVMDSSIKFESAFAGVRKTVTATEAEFKKLSTGLLDMATRIPITTTELARIQELAGQLGVRGVDNLTKFTDTIAKISITTNLTSERAATAFARIANVMQEPLDNVDRMGATVVDLGNNFATTEAEIVEFSNRIAAAGNVAGLSTADIMGVATAFSSVGVRAERGGTAVSKALIMMGTAVSSGGDDLKAFADIAGMTSEQFIKAYESNAAGAFSAFIEGLGKQGLKGAEILKDLELGDQRLIQAFLSVGGASGILTLAVQMANIAWEENAALTEEANKRIETTESKMIILGNAFDNLKIAIGDDFNPVLKELLDNLSALVISFTDLYEQESPLRDFFDNMATAMLNPLGTISELIDKFYEFGVLAGSGQLTLDDLPGGPPEGQSPEEAEYNQKQIESEQALKEMKLASMKADAKKTEQGIINSKKLTKEQEDQAKKTQEGYMAMGTAASGLFGNLATLMAQQGEKGAAAAKAFGIVQAIVSTAMGIARAFADFPYPIALGISGLVAASGAVQIATIAGAAEGGITQSSGAVMIGEQGPEILDFPRGARITPLNRATEQGVGGGISGITVNIDSANFREDQGVDDVFGEISEMLEEQRRSRI